MSKPVLGAALSIKSIPAHRDWLLERQRDLEIQDFFRADLLDGDWRSAASE
ncbi:MAG: sugar phosphate isomerase/epimerase, partial [Bradyrhizobium sp.]|nr:sugar phosphate isomerase/epimerase [Bradyrhizobium sp.]